MQVLDNREIIMLVGLLVVITGWIVTHYLGRIKDRAFEKMKWEKSEVDLQLSEFYGPIYGILLENERLRRIIQEQFGRNIIFELGKPLSEQEKQIWVHYLENYFLPNNNRIVEILRTKVHLLHGYRYPKSHLQFIDYAIGYDALHRQYRDLNRDYGFHQQMNFPVEFQKDIVDTISSLKKKQWEMVEVCLPEPHGDLS